MRPLACSSLVIATAAVFLSACASVKVQGSREAALPPKSKPRAIYVAAFSTEGADFKVDREGQELAAFKQATSQMLAVKMIERMPEIAPTKAVPEAMPSSGWLITGRFKRVNQGSRALRTVVGFGAGGTKMETQVRVFDLSRPGSEPFLTFETTGGSNAEPGLITAVGPGAVGALNMAATALGGSAHGISEDSWRTAREIRNYLVSYINKHRLE